jgi:arsenate reductase
MACLFITYPKCSTCQKAKKWLEEQGVAFEERHIVENNPTMAEIDSWLEKSGLPLKRFFNTSGMRYRELGLKDRMKEESEESLKALLATDGMLVKRPILVTDKGVTTGFKADEWEKLL